MNKDDIIKALAYGDSHLISQGDSLCKSVDGGAASGRTCIHFTIGAIPSPTGPVDIPPDGNTTDRENSMPGL